MKRSILSIFLISAVLQASAATLFWQDIPESAFVNHGSRSWTPKAYRTLSIDLNVLREQLRQVTSEQQTPVRQSGSVIVLPLPDGTSLAFRISESPVMAAELGAAYPGIRTYSAEGLNDTRYVAKLDVTVFGFHAMVFSPSGVYYIDPYVQGNTGEYICYYKNDVTSLLPSMVCETEEALDANTGAVVQPQSYPVLRSSGTILRTYRLALACTGEYAQFYGGTKAGALSGMVTSINRCNGVFEREFAIHLDLVPNDTLLIYLNGANDPYSNNSGSSMLGQNQTNIDNLIGGANYDIGHVFSTGGGGVAYKGCVCSSLNKAKGVTGSSGPVGDPFDIDYVVHEMGHQFGADHTFNATSGSCSGNRVSSAAYEPGSASTIMGYAGICGTTNDLQLHSDDYYQTYSFDQISAYMINGSGNSCAVTAPIVNTPPVVAFSGNYIIPYQTPFRLTTTATDADGDPLTYCWEQMDHGPSGSWNSPSGDAPIFRSFSPAPTGTRYFPVYTTVLNGTGLKGELMASYGRTLHFRCTARDNRAGGGAIAYNDTLTAVQVINTGSGFAVTYPNATGIIWEEGTTQTITWNVAQSDVAPVSTPMVNIYLSTDNGQSWSDTLAMHAANSGSYTFTVPARYTSAARIWVEGDGNIFYDVNNAPFSITQPTGLTHLELSGFTVYPNPSSGMLRAEWGRPAGTAWSLDVLDALGAVVYRTAPGVHALQTEIDLRSLPAGVYFLRMHTDDGMFTRKLVLVSEH